MKSLLLAFLLALGACASDVPAGPGADTPGGPPQAMQVFEPDTGVVLTEGTLVRTDTGGKRWRSLTPSGVDLTAARGLDFFDTDRGWLVVEAPKRSEADIVGFIVYATSDAGRSWKAGSTVATEGVNIDTVDLVGPKSGYISVRKQSSSNFSVGELHFTADSGETWTKLDLPSGGPIDFFDQDFGWLAGGPIREELYSTVDGGKTWAKREVPRPFGYEQSTVSFAVPQFFDKSRGVMAARLTGAKSGFVTYVTSDSGATWTPQEVQLASGELDSGLPPLFDAVDAATWFGTVEETRILSSTDAGKTWVSTPTTGLPAGLEAIDFAESGFGWALTLTRNCRRPKEDCAQVNTLAQTKDSGKTWRKLEP